MPTYQKVIGNQPDGVSLTEPQVRVSVSAQTGAIFPGAATPDHPLYREYDFYPESLAVLLLFQQHDFTAGSFDGQQVLVPASDIPLVDILPVELAYADQAAGQVRAKYITVAPGQELTYNQKVLEATGYQSNPAGNYPFLSAEAAATGQTVSEVAALVLATRDAWLPVGAAIEAARMGYKAAIAAAQSVADVRAARVIFDEALAGL